MKEHLDDGDVTEFLLDMPSNAAEAHILTCDPCCAEVEDARAAVMQIRASLRDAAHRPETFWSMQEARILQRAQRRPAGRAMAPVWAAACALILLAVLLLRAGSPQIEVAAQPDPDDVLLEQVQADLYQQVPSALAPAVVIAQERNRMMQASGQ